MAIFASCFASALPDVKSSMTQLTRATRRTTSSADTGIRETRKPTMRLSLRKYASISSGISAALRASADPPRLLGLSLHPAARGRRPHSAHTTARRHFHRHVCAPDTALASPAAFEKPQGAADCYERLRERDEGERGAK